MAPTALALDAATLGKLKSRSSVSTTTAAPAPAARVTVAVDVAVASPPKQQPQPPPTAAVLPNKAPIPPRHGQARGNHHYYKEIAVDAGRLGITLQFTEDGSGAIIRQISPSCTFRHNIQIGDRIVNIDGRPLTKRDDLDWKKDSLRIFGIIAQEKRPATETAKQAMKIQNEVVANECSINAKSIADAADETSLQSFGKRQREAMGNSTEEAKEEFDSWHNSWKKHMKATSLYYRKRHADGWEQRLKELIRYKVHHQEGDWQNVPLDCRDPDDLTLGEWVRKQRELYWEGKLDRERVTILQSHGFDFDYKSPSETLFSGDRHWDNKLKEMEHLNTDVPQRKATWGLHQSKAHVKRGRCAWKGCPGLKNTKAKRPRTYETYMHCEDCSALFGKCMFFCNNHKSGKVVHCHEAYHTRYHSKEKPASAGVGEKTLVGDKQTKNGGESAVIESKPRARGSDKPSVTIESKRTTRSGQIFGGTTTNKESPPAKKQKQKHPSGTANDV